LQYNLVTVSNPRTGHIEILSCHSWKRSFKIVRHHHSVSYRIAMGPQQGQKVFTLQTLPASTEGEYGQLANTSGFSLHAGVFFSPIDFIGKVAALIPLPRLNLTRFGLPASSEYSRQTGTCEHK
jgi:hypothetical protein